MSTSQQHATRVSSSPRRTTKPAFKNILVPVDFSPAGKPALNYAKSLATLVGARICLLHVRELIYTEATFAFSAFDTAEMREHIEREIGALQADVFKGVKTNFEVCDGLPYQEIVSVAAKQNSDLIVMATHGYTGLKHVLLGSTAERVVRHAHCPVLVVRSHASKPAK